MKFRRRYKDFGVIGIDKQGWRRGLGVCIQVRVFWLWFNYKRYSIECYL